MQLTLEQIEAVRNGRSVCIDNSEIGAPCVVIRADRFANLSLANDEFLTHLEVGTLIENTMKEYDAEDPLLHLYQEMVR